MDHIAQIEGLQDTILYKLPSSHLSKMVSFSREWVKPSLDRIRQKLAQISKVFIQDLGEETSVSPTARGKFGWKRQGFPFQPFPGGHGWAYLRGVMGYRWAYANMTEDVDWPTNPKNASKVIKLLRNLLFTNCRSGSHNLTHKYNEYRDLCVKHNILRHGALPWNDKWSHILYQFGDMLFHQRLQLELKREKLVKLFRIALPEKNHQYYINNFAKATRPDLMVQRLKDLTYRLQKT
jgi:hypothetical protein